MRRHSFTYRNPLLSPLLHKKHLSSKSWIWCNGVMGFFIHTTERKHNDGLYVLTHKTLFKIRIEIRVIWQCLSLTFEETWEINIAKKEFSNTVLWVWMVLAWFCRKNEDLASSCLPQWPEIQNYVQKFWALFSSYCSEIWLDLPITHIVDNNGKQ